MGNRLGQYTVTADEKRGTLVLAGWTERDGRWYRSTPSGPATGPSYTLDAAWRLWRDQ